MGNSFTEEWYAARQAKMARQQPQPHPVAREASSEPHRTQVGGRIATAAPKASKQRPEEALQKLVAAFLDRALPQPYRWLHIPNQRGTRDRWENELLKAMGVKAGAADVLVLTPTGRFVWIELKSGTGRLSAEQEEWRDWCRSIGAPWFLCRSLEDVIEALGSLQIRLRVRA